MPVPFIFFIPVFSFVIPDLIGDPVFIYLGDLGYREAEIAVSWHGLQGYSNFMDEVILEVD